MSDPKPTAVREATSGDPAEPAEADEIPDSWWLWIRTPVLGFTATILALVSLLALWAANLYLTVGGSLDKIEVSGIADPWDFGKNPRNVLLLGSDSRAGLSEEEQAAFGSEQTVGGQRSDTIILMSIDPRREQAVVVHFPRDLRVEIPGHGLDKINAAYSYGGPDLVVKTVRDFTGLRIDNYMEIDLAGFEHLVDTLGGVRVCVDRPMFDELAGLAIPKAGCYLMDGPTALAFVRARHVEGDAIPDFSRIARQQQFMRATMNKLLSVDSLLNDRVIREAVGALKVDSSVNTGVLLELGRRLRALAEEDPTGAESLDLRVVPGHTETIGDVSYVIAEAEAKKLFEALKEGRGLGRLGQSLALTQPTPGIIKVRVFSTRGTGPEGAETILRDSGFIVLDSEVYSAKYEKTQIIYKDGARSRARVLSGYFPEVRVREVPSAVLGEAEVGLIVGEDWEKVTG
jgi:LCP family protein required for cell wall assembly